MRARPRQRSHRFFSSHSRAHAFERQPGATSDGKKDWFKCECRTDRSMNTDMDTPIHTHTLVADIRASIDMPCVRTPDAFGEKQLRLKSGFFFLFANHHIPPDAHHKKAAKRSNFSTNARNRLVKQARTFRCHENTNNQSNALVVSGKKQ
jgi:hypothetical protein